MSSWSLHSSYPAMPTAGCHGGTAWRAADTVEVGTDVYPDGVYINYQHAAFYTDGGAGGVGTFRLDTGWAPYTPAVQFTTFALPTTSASCKNGAWQNLVRSDFTSFKNQGACVSYAQTGR